MSLEQVQDLLSGKVAVKPQTAMTIYQDIDIRYPLAELKQKGEIELKPNALALDPEEAKSYSWHFPEPAAESKVPKGHFRITEARVLIRLKYGPVLGRNATLAKACR